jgi:hypothetical protein
LSIRKWLLVAGALASWLAAPAVAGVTGTLHINAGYMHQSVSLVPEKEVDFEPDSPPETLDYSQQFTTGEPPEITYGRTAETWMDGEDGQLSAYASAELNGIPPSAQSSYGIYGEAELRGFDYLNVTSDVLDDGDEVDVAFDIAVIGTGRVSVRERVDRIGTGGSRTNVLQLSYDDNGGGGSVTDYTHDTITAKVGELYAIEYTLLVSAGLTPFGMNTPESNRYVASDYPAVDFYAAPVGGVGVILDANSGHDYTPAPEAAAESSSLAAFGVLGWRRRGKRARGESELAS